MKEASDSTFCVIDSGLYIPLARRLSKDAKRVLLFSPECRPWKSIKQDCIGDGFPGVERIDEKDFWRLTDQGEIDCYCFADCDLAGLQLHLEGMGKAVWGSRLGQEFERNRQQFLKILKQLGLEVPKVQHVVGLKKLREHLKDREDCYIKISNYRADMETFHWRNWNVDEVWLDYMACKFGPKLKDHVPLMVCDTIDTDLEIGCDLYSVDGKYPVNVINALEGKDKVYFGTVTPFEDLPDQNREVMEAISPLLEEWRYRNQISVEIRVKGDKAYFIDPTQRGAIPASGSLYSNTENFSEIVLAGSIGELVDPEFIKPFSMEVIINGKTPKGCARIVELPKELEENVAFSDCCYVDGCYVFPHNPDCDGDQLGWLYATGSSPKNVLDNIKELADQLPDGLSADVEGLAAIIEEVDSMKENDIPFTDKPMPEPAEVL